MNYFYTLQAVPLEDISHVGDFDTSGQEYYYDYVEERNKLSPSPEYTLASDCGDSRSEVTKSIVLKAIRDLKCRNMA